MSVTETTSVKVQTKLSEGLQMEYPNLSFNEIMNEISSERNRRSRKPHRKEDVLYAIEQITGYREKYPKISVEELQVADTYFLYLLRSCKMT